MAVRIVTGRKGEAHISSDDEKARNIEAFGKYKFIFNMGARLWATRVDDNTVSVASGMCMSGGVQMGIAPFDNEVLTFDSGTAGFKRHDLIVMRYTRDTELDVETAELAVIKGEPVAQDQTPNDPEYTEGDILGDGATLDETPLWRVVFHGTDLLPLTSSNCLLTLRSGYKNTDPEEEDPHTTPDADNNYTIFPSTIDKLWGSGIDDYDTRGF